MLELYLLPRALAGVVWVCSKLEGRAGVNYKIKLAPPARDKRGFNHKPDSKQEGKP